MARTCRIGGRTLELMKGDITTQDVDAIVNAANSSLMGGGGVDGAIHRAGGPAILGECKDIVAQRGRLPAGQAVITTGGDLRARHVIHTVGPVWHGGDRGEPQTLAGSYRESLKVAADNGLATVAFPSISTGAFGYPVELAAEVALAAVTLFLSQDTPVREVRFVLFDNRTYEAYSDALDELGVCG